jgi:hypothetical protein
MNQQINLYQPIFREERKLFSLNTVVLSLAIVVSALMAMWAIGAHNVNGLAKAVEELKLQRAAQERMALAAGVMLDAQGNPTVAEEQVKSLGARLAERTNALNLLRGGAAGQPKGFADRMSALASRHTEGVWLDQLFLSGGTNGLMLRGRSIDADLVPKYLQTLTTSPDLSGARFDVVEIDRRRSHDARIETAKEEGSTTQSLVRFSVASSTLSNPFEDKGASEKQP